MRQAAELVRLAAGYFQDRGSPSARLDAELLLAHTLGLSRIELYVQFDRPVTPVEVDRFRELTRRRGAGEPVAYILGEKEFRGRRFVVNPAVLIPRPETELLVEAVLTLWRDKGYHRGPVIDVGTGSGIIAICLALEHVDCRLVAVDVAKDALAVARRNAALHGVEDRITFYEGDLLEPVQRGSVAAPELIVSNPPYVAAQDWDRLDPGVRDYEPRTALDGGPDGLDILRRLIRDSAAVLPAGGHLALEVGAGQRRGVDDALHRAGFRDVAWQEDWAGHPRVVLARRGEDGAGADAGGEGNGP